MKRKFYYYYVELKENKVYLKCHIENNNIDFFNKTIMDYIEYTRKNNCVIKFYELVAEGNMQLLCKIDKGQLYTY